MTAVLETMDRIEFSMHRGSSLVTLSEILALIGPGPWTWRVLDFDGIGIAPGGVAWSDFDDELRSQGRSMDWEELTRFAAGLDQTWDCLNAALRPGDARAHRERAKVPGPR